MQADLLFTDMVKPTQEVKRYILAQCRSLDLEIQLLMKTVVNGHKCMDVYGCMKKYTMYEPCYKWA